VSLRRDVANVCMSHFQNSAYVAIKGFRTDPVAQTRYCRTKCNVKK
jgi:hypothetical protein